MGRLERRIREIQFRGAKDPVRLVQEDRRRLELKRREDKALESAAEANTRREKAKEDKALHVSLKGLLRTVGARELLGDMQKVYGGRVDWFPYEIPNAAEMLNGYSPLQFPGLPAFPAMGLGLRYKFRDTEGAKLKQWYGYAFDGSYWSRRELFIATIVGFGYGDLPYVASFYGSRISPDSPPNSYYSRGSKKDDGSLKDNTNYCIGYSGQNIIFPDNPDKSRSILEGQLFGINEKAPPFRVLEAFGVERVMNDYNLPGRARWAVSPFWYKRLAAHIPIANLFIGY